MPSSAVAPDSNFSVVRGDAVAWTLTVTFPSNAISQNLNTYSITMTAKRHYVDPDSAAVFILSKANGKILVDSTFLNVAHLNLSASDTYSVACLPPTNQTTLVYDVEVVGTDLRPYTVARGTISVVADATLALP